MALPFYQKLREVYSSSHLTLVGPMKFPEFDSCFSLDEFHTSFFHLGISLPASFRAALWLFQSGARQRVGYAEVAARIFYDDSLAWPGRSSGKHKSEIYLDLLRWMSGFSMKLPTIEANRTRAEKLILLAPGASIPLREWPYFPELAVELEARYPDHALVLLGTDEEKKWLSLFSRHGVKRIEDRLGKTSLEEVTSLSRRAAAVVTNDSGIAHLSSTLGGAPTIVLFGPGDPHYIQPLGPKVFPVWAEGVPCRPCESATCRAPYGYQRCLKEISVRQVLERLTEALT